MKILIGTARAWAVIGLALGALVLLPPMASAQIPGGEMEVEGEVKSPRAEAHIGDLEAVVTYVPATGRTRLAAAMPQILSVYLQGYDDGRPVHGATVDLLVNGVAGVLQETDDGVFVSHDWVLQSGRNDVALTVTAGGTTGTETLTLTVPTISTNARLTAPVEVQNAVVPGYVFAIGAVAVYLLVQTMFLVRRRREAAARRRRAGLDDGLART